MPSDAHLTDVASGQTMAHSLQFRVLDFDGQVIESDNSSALIIQSVDSNSIIEGET